MLFLYISGESNGRGRSEWGIYYFYRLNNFRSFSSKFIRPCILGGKYKVSSSREIARKAGTVLDGTTCSGLQLRQVRYQRCQKPFLHLPREKWASSICNKEEQQPHVSQNKSLEVSRYYKLLGSWILRLVFKSVRVHTNERLFPVRMGRLAWQIKLPYFTSTWSFSFCIVWDRHYPRTVRVLPARVER